MNAETAFAVWVKKHDLYDLPWQIDSRVLHDAYMAGWNDRDAVRSSLLATAGDDPVEAIYQAYPRKIGKVAARKAIARALKTSGMSCVNMLNRVKVYAGAVAAWPTADKQYIPHPATWFNQGRYDDNPKEWERGGAAGAQFSKTYGTQ